MGVVLQEEAALLEGVGLQEEGAEVVVGEELKVGYDCSLAPPLLLLGVTGSALGCPFASDHAPYFWVWCF